MRHIQAVFSLRIDLELAPTATDGAAHAAAAAAACCGYGHNGRRRGRPAAAVPAQRQGAGAAARLLGGQPRRRRRGDAGDAGRRTRAAAAGAVPRVDNGQERGRRLHAVAERDGGQLWSHRARSPSAAASPLAWLHAPHAGNQTLRRRTHRCSPSR
jgi:hypothetical protein